MLSGWIKGLYTNKVYYQESTGIALGEVYESTGVAVVVETDHYWMVFCLVYTKSSWVRVNNVYLLLFKHLVACETFKKDQILTVKTFQTQCIAGFTHALLAK